MIPSMTREAVQRRHSEQRAELAELGVRSLDIFGSVARGEEPLKTRFDAPSGLERREAEDSVALGERRADAPVHARSSPLRRLIAI
jgi:hypothetical protein